MSPTPATPSATPSVTTADVGKPGPYAGLRVIEFGDESGEHCGLLLAGLGAEVIKVEPAEGAPSRRIGPFLGDKPNPEESLHFWHYNRNKKSVVLPAENARAKLLELVGGADVVLDSSCGALNVQLGLNRPQLLEHFQHLVLARLTPFGDTGPLEGLQGQRPGASGAGRRDDELRLRPGPLGPL